MYSVFLSKFEVHELLTFTVNYIFCVNYIFEQIAQGKMCSLNDCTFDDNNDDISKKDLSS